MDDRTDKAGTAVAVPKPQQDVRMDGVDFYRTSLSGAVRRVLDPGHYSYCVMVKSGRFDLLIDFPNPETIALSGGDVVAISGLAAHAFVPANAGTEEAPFIMAPMSNAPGQDVDLIVGVAPNEALALGSFIIGPIVIRADSQPAIAQQLWRAADMLEAEFQVEYSPDRALVVRRLAEIMLINLTRRAVRESVNESTSRSAAGVERQIVKALDAFLEAPDRNWDLPTLARVAGMSRTRFAQTFKAVTGQTPAHVVSRLRMASIARRLVTENLTIEAAAEAAGYSSAAAFVRAFQREHGETPARWRRRASEVGERAPVGSGLGRIQSEKQEP